MRVKTRRRIQGRKEDLTLRKKNLFSAGLIPEEKPFGQTAVKEKGDGMYNLWAPTGQDQKKGTIDLRPLMAGPTGTPLGPHTTP